MTPGVKYLTADQIKSPIIGIFPFPTRALFDGAPFPIFLSLTYLDPILDTAIYLCHW